MSESQTVENLLLDLLVWIAARDRTYEEVMDAWRTSCPRLPVWEEANARSLVRKAPIGSAMIVTLTDSGQALLRSKAC